MPGPSPQDSRSWGSGQGPLLHCRQVLALEEAPAHLLVEVQLPFSCQCRNLESLFRVVHSELLQVGWGSTTPIASLSLVLTAGGHGKAQSSVLGMVITKSAPARMFQVHACSEGTTVIDHHLCAVVCRELGWCGCLHCVLGGRRCSSVTKGLYCNQHEHWKHPTAHLK